MPLSLIELPPAILGSIPYVAALGVYWANYRRDFHNLKSTALENWAWHLLQPVLLALFSPLVLLGRPNLDRGEVIDIATVVAVGILAVVTLIATAGRREYFLCQQPYGTSKYVITSATPAKIVLLGGSVCIIAAGLVSIFVSQQI